jgi:hypothetical protein
MADAYQYEQVPIGGPAQHAALVTPDDSNDLANFTRAVYIGSVSGGAAMKVTTVGGETLLLSGLLAGHVYPIRVKRIWSTTTTATLIVALW